MRRREGKGPKGGVYEGGGQMGGRGEARKKRICKERHMVSEGSAG